MNDVRPTTGDVLDRRYRLTERVGRGGMADVYAAVDLRDGGRVAVKVFRDDVADAIDPNRTTRELRILGGLHAPTIVEVLAASEAGAEHPYLVMELVLGGNLGASIADGPLTPERVRRIGLDIAGALAALHERHLVHRDVKPANILVPHDGPIAAKLADFGIALAIDSTRLTATNSILGTAAYLSPEQVQGTAVGPASDVYALGLVLIEALTGARAFGGSLAETAVARLTRAPALPADASLELARLLIGMTALEPTDRPTAFEVTTMLDALEGGMVAAALPTTEVHELPPTAVLAAADVRAAIPSGSSRPRIGAVLVAAAVLTVAGIGGGSLIAAGFHTPTVQAAASAPTATPKTAAAEPKAAAPSPTVAPTTQGAAVPAKKATTTTVATTTSDDAKTTKSSKHGATSNDKKSGESAAQRLRNLVHDATKRHGRHGGPVASLGSKLKSLFG
jgi:eukaryotic-like serine/threonine-protein kinase